MSFYIREKNLSPEALKQLSQAENKSLFVREAIEFYVHHGKDILKELKDIKELVKNVPNLSTSKEIQISGKTVQESPVVTQDNSNKNKEVSKLIELKNEVHEQHNNKTENKKDVISEEKKKEIEQQILKSINMIS